MPAGLCKPGTCFTDAHCGGAVGSCDTTTGLCRFPQSRLNCTAAAQCPGFGATCTIPTDMNASTGWCVKKVDAPTSDAAEAAETRCTIPGLVGGTTSGTVATVPGVYRSGTAGVGFENESDMDPARRHVLGRNQLNSSSAGLDANPAEQVADACGNLGVVLPISIPPDTVNAFPNVVCGNGKLNFFPGIQIGSGPSARFQLCPNGDMPFGATAWDPVIRGALGGSGTCLVPVKPTDASSANCLNGGSNRPGVQFVLPPKTYVNYPDPALIDGRVYNLQVFLPSSPTRLTQSYVYNGQEQPPVATPPDTAAAFNENVTGAFYRIHSTRTAKGYSAKACNENTDCAAPFPTCDVGVHQCFNNTEAGCSGVGPDGSTKACCENAQDTNQIGCLVIANPCSIGYGGLSSLSTANPALQLIAQPTAGGTQVIEHNFSIGLDKIVGGNPIVLSANADNACVPVDNLSVSPKTYQYPIARNLYLSSIVGFESPLVTSGELALARCISGRGDPTVGQLNSSSLNNLLLSNGFVPNGFAADPGSYPCCKDFDETTCAGTVCNTDAECTGSGSTCVIAVHKCTNGNACLGNDAPAVNLPANTCVY